MGQRTADEVEAGEATPLRRDPPDGGLLLRPERSRRARPLARSDPPQIQTTTITTFARHTSGLIMPRLRNASLAGKQGGGLTRARRSPGALSTPPTGSPATRSAEARARERGSRPRRCEINAAIRRRGRRRRPCDPRRGERRRRHDRRGGRIDTGTRRPLACSSPGPGAVHRPGAPARGEGFRCASGERRGRDHARTAVGPGRGDDERCALGEPAYDLHRACPRHHGRVGRRTRRACEATD